MRLKKFSIRNQLLLLAALATASIWAGAALQYAELRSRSRELLDVRRHLDDVARYSGVVRYAAQERGLTNGWLLQAAAGNVSDLADVRQQLDASLAAAVAAHTSLDAPSEVAARVPGGVPAELPIAVNAQVSQLARTRNQINHRQIYPQEAFDFYSALVDAANSTIARRLADGMLVIGVPYEHAYHLQRAAEFLARLRGLLTGALAQGALSQQTETELMRQLVLYKDSLQAYDRSVPDAARLQLAPLLGATAVQESVERVQRLLVLRRLDAVGMTATAWFALATEAVDSLQQASLRESASLATQADVRITGMERRLNVTVWSLVVLGVLTLALALSTVERIVRGINRLLDSVNEVSERRNFALKVSSSSRDEFGVISVGINKLINMAASVAGEHEAMSLIDPLTNVMNRRGFDRQLAARTTPGREHAPPLSLVMVDVDHFKNVNDTCGHAGGDAVLVGLAQVLTHHLRPDDVLARFGGEEFVALLTGCPLNEALAVAEKLRSAVEQHDFGINRPVTISLGVSQWSRDHTTEACVQAADAQLYVAKQAGRNRVMPLFAAQEGGDVS